MTVVLCDMDGIVANLHEKLLKRLNEKHGRDDTNKWTVEDIVEWRVEDALGLEEDEAWNIISEDGFFEDLKVIEGAKKALFELQSNGLEVVMLTTPTLNPESFAEKKRWIMKNMPFIKHKHFMLGELKYLVKADYFIDDSPKQQKQYRKAWPKAKILTIRYPFEPDAGVDYAAESYKYPEAAWQSIKNYILTYESTIKC